MTVGDDHNFMKSEEGLWVYHRQQHGKITSPALLAPECPDGAGLMILNAGHFRAVDLAYCGGSQDLLCACQSLWRQALADVALTRYCCLARRGFPPNATRERPLLASTYRRKFSWRLPIVSEIAEDSDPRAGESWRRGIERHNVMAIESEQCRRIGVSATKLTSHRGPVALQGRPFAITQ